MDAEQTDNLFYSAFNARWVEPEQVARGFVSVSQFGKLSQAGHSVLAGPRGCGKTTLLKMLTRRALRVWRDERQPQLSTNPFEYPTFEAIYIPADARWFREVQMDDAPRSADEDSVNAGRVFDSAQRALINCTLMRAFAAWAEHSIDSPEIRSHVAARWRAEWGLRRRLAHLPDIAMGLNEHALRLRSAVNRSDPVGSLARELEQLPAIYFADLLDVAEQCVLAVESVADTPRPSHWALCFDELELAPTWMQQQLFWAMRAAAQRFFLKLTWSPIVPFASALGPEPSHDYEIIRLWYSHVRDGYVFCERLAGALVRRRFGPAASVGHLLLDRLGKGADSTVDESDDAPVEAADSPAEREQFELAVASLARRDPTFLAHLTSVGLRPEAIQDRTAHVSDTLIRKAKPLVLFRNEFWGEHRLRSRKSVYMLYCGPKTLYAMSDGNPRWLVGLLTDLIELGAEGRFVSIPPRTQASILSDASNRFLRRLGAVPIGEKSTPRGWEKPLDMAYSPSLSSTVERFAQYLRGEVLGREFNLDPAGSILLDEVPTWLEPVLLRGLEVGALVAVGAGRQDVPIQLAGMRLRLSFMLSPAKKLLMRTLRAVPLSQVLRGTTPDGQLPLRDFALEDPNVASTSGDSGD